MVTLCGQIYPWIWTTIETVEARLESAHRPTMSKLQVELHAYIDVFEGGLSVWFSSIETSDLGDIRKELGILRVCSPNLPVERLEED